jgi:branched-chain amino acid transport system substrate-binding protein
MRKRQMRHSYRALIALIGVLALVAAACGTDETDPEPETVEEAPEPEPEPEPEDEPEDVAPAEGEPYRIGVIVAMSGPASSLGIPEGNTARMLEEQINAAGGIEGPDGQMHPLEIVLLDTQSEETETLLATRQLIERDQVPVIVGPTQSGTTMAIVDTVQEAEVPLISLAAAAAIVEPVKEWVFKTPQTDRLVQQVLVDHFQAEGINSVAWMSVDTGFGDTGRVEWLQMVEDHGFDMVADERFSTGDTDMSAQLTRVAQTDADAILVWAIPPEAAVVTRNYAELGIDIPMYQSHGVGNRAYIEVSGGAAEGIRFPAGKLLVADDLPDDDPQKEVLTQYAADYEAEFGDTPSTFGGHGWDGIMMAVEALGACGEDRVCIRDYLENDIRDFVGISGVFNMSPDDHMGLDTGALVMVRIENDDWVLAE